MFESGFGSGFIPLVRVPILSISESGFGSRFYHSCLGPAPGPDSTNTQKLGISGRNRKKYSMFRVVKIKQCTEKKAVSKTMRKWLLSQKLGSHCLGSFVQASVLSW